MIFLYLKAHCVANDCHKTGKVASNMTHNESHCCTIDHDEVKNNFHMKDGLV